MSAVDDAAKRSLRRDAVNWIHHFDSGHATKEDAEDFRRWRTISSEHEAALVEASGMWKAFGPAARNLRQRRAIPPALVPRGSLTRTISRRAALTGGLATASAVAYAVVHPPLDLWPSLAELRADYRTSTGEQHEFALHDDVSVRLNTQTSIAIDQSAADQIELIAGEAFFVSRPSPQRPLVVLAAHGRMTASRADFDVRRTGSEVCVTCIDGDVAVELPANARTIGPGQQIRYDRSGFGEMVTVDIELVTAWRQGTLIFRSTPLSQVVEEINRYRPGRVLLLGAELARKPVSGRFRIDHMEEILLRLDQAFGIKTRSLPGGIILLS